MTDITPHRIEIDEEELTDLRRRLAATRWPESETVDDWTQGIPLAYTKEVCEYWASSYDWRRLENRLNDLDQFRTEIDGLGIHFLHLRSKHRGAAPLVMTHGWPGSIVEFLEVFEPLLDPTAHGGSEEDAFHLVVPALPGIRLLRQAGRRPAGASRGSPTPGPNSWPGSATSGTSRRAATGARRSARRSRSRTTSTATASI